MRHRCITILPLVLLFAASVAHALTISDVSVTDVTDNSASVKWTTDVNTDAMINYGLDSAVGIVRDATYNTKTHLLTIQNLEPATTYHFRVVSTDASGNKSASAGFVLTTKDNQVVQAKKAIQDIKKVTDPEQLQEVVQAVQQQARDVILPPSIIGLPSVTPTPDGAVITWSSDRPASSLVDLVSDAEYSAASADPYTIHQGQPHESTTHHTVTVIGLEPATVYHFRVSSTDSAGLQGVSADATFETRSQLPVISNLTVSRIQETSAMVSWSTIGVPAKGRIEYQNLRTKVARTVGDPVLAASHQVLLTGLEFGTRYKATVFATNQAGDEVASKPFSFVTVRDVIPPAISKVKNESTLYPGEDTKVQTIITWETDEPATCQVSYTQGLIHDAANQGQSLPIETDPLTNHTQVIVGFAPGTVYKFWMDCADPTGNSSKSDDFVLITPVQEKNIIDIILQNFQGTFGWVNKIGK